MSHAINLFRTLERDWQREGASRRARTALTRWAEGQPALSGFTSPLEVVQRCHDRGQRHGSRALLVAVLSWAQSDPLAARTALQAVLPGLAGVSRRAYGFVGPTGVWQAIDELDQHVVAVAYERIHALSATGDRWGATSIVDGTWQRIRSYALASLRERDRRAELSEHGVGELRAGPDRSGAEELAAALLDAVQRGILERVDAGIVYECHIQGRAVEALAPAVGRDVRSVWRRRARAEQLLLIEAGGGPSDATSDGLSVRAAG